MLLNDGRTRLCSELKLLVRTGLIGGPLSAWLELRRLPPCPDQGFLWVRARAAGAAW